MRSVGLLRRARQGFVQATDFPLIATPAPESVTGIRFSDHGSFWDQGFPALMITDTAFFRNPHYHLASDTPGTLDYERMARVCIGVAGAVAVVAG